MMKCPRTLSAAFVRTVNRPGVYGDGRGGLSLRVHRTLDGRITKAWRQRVRINGQFTSIGLGPYPEVTLAEAAERMIKIHRAGWKAGSPLPEQWESTFRLHAALLLDKPVDRITSTEVLRCLTPIWNSKPAAARKAKHRITAVFRWFIGRNYAQTTRWTV